jgi:hypothetical protein
MLPPFPERVVVRIFPWFEKRESKFKTKLPPKPSPSCLAVMELLGFRVRVGVVIPISPPCPVGEVLRTPTSWAKLGSKIDADAEILLVSLRLLSVMLSEALMVIFPAFPVDVVDVLIVPPSAILIVLASMSIVLALPLARVLEAIWEGE